MKINWRIKQIIKNADKGYYCNHFQARLDVKYLLRVLFEKINQKGEVK